MTIVEYLHSIGCSKIYKLTSHRKLIYSANYNSLTFRLMASSFSNIKFQAINNPSPKLLIKLYRLGMLTNV